ncbi:hypothetical protein CORC01_13875 [Colletotrichum orchidophilum]|uniref:Uncharacterized protein n=1 Tax=Colletotrichum orchidophilum TaxID=1209926 RepID=A0A1G4ANZ3_9PEZI|nr:uncharacterized protein CORC01_13875 [Colletotrichum orchidophilum]OHE90831.1 hypothetical protein CORC01_13875 [Colletotrichum orchidophilum]
MQKATFKGFILASYLALLMLSRRDRSTAPSTLSFRPSANGLTSAGEAQVGSQISGLNRASRTPATNPGPKPVPILCGQHLTNPLSSLLRVRVKGQQHPIENLEYAPLAAPQREHHLPLVWLVRLGNRRSHPERGGAIKRSEPYRENSGAAEILAWGDTAGDTASSASAASLFHAICIKHPALRKLPMAALIRIRRVCEAEAQHLGTGFSIYGKKETLIPVPVILILITIASTPTSRSQTLVLGCQYQRIFQSS